MTACSHISVEEWHKNFVLAPNELLCNRITMFVVHMLTWPTLCPHCITMQNQPQWIPIHFPTAIVSSESTILILINEVSCITHGVSIKYFRYFYVKQHSRWTDEIKQRTQTTNLSITSTCAKKDFTLLALRRGTERYKTSFQIIHKLFNTLL